MTRDSTYISIKLKGVVKESERKNVILVNTYVLQNIIVSKNKFIETTEDTLDFRLLIKHALSEAKFLTNQFKTGIQIQMDKAPEPLGANGLVWFFELPQSAGSNAKYQIFVSRVLGNKIFGLSSTQFQGQKFEHIRDFLLGVINTAKLVNSKSDFENLCNQ